MKSARTPPFRQAVIAVMPLMAWQVAAKSVRDGLFLQQFPPTALPAIVAISLVYAATRHERMKPICAHAARVGVWIVGFMFVVAEADAAKAMDAAADARTTVTIPGVGTFRAVDVAAVYVMSREQSERNDRSIFDLVFGRRG